LFRAAAGGNASQNREQLIELLGFDKDGVREKIEEAVSRFRKEGKLSTTNNSQPLAESTEPVEPISSQHSESEVREEENGNGLGNGDGASSLFGDNSGGAGDDFFSQIGAGSNQRLSALPERLLAKEGGSLDGYNSAAATIGSTSSIASLNLKPSTFKLYRPSSTGDGADNTNRLITQALVVGDFNSAVSLALATERYADALLFAFRGGSELLAQTQSAYFARAQQDASTSGSASYLRVLESITMNDLSDIVQNADLEDWIEVFVLLCTYAIQEEEFGSLVEQLGQRLEYQFQLVRGSPNPAQSDEWRKNAVLCYLAAGKLEKVVGVWIGQMKEEEAALKSQLGGSASASASFEAHARALQDFVEKVQVFQHAVGYVDVDLQSPTQSSAVADSGARTYKLASLYERYVEYAELLAEQGLLQLAVKYINLTPSDFEGTKPEASGPALARERLLKASGIRRTATSYGQAQPHVVQQQQATSRYASAYGTPQQSNLSSSTRSAYNPYGTPSSVPAPSIAPAPTSYNPYAAPPSLSASTSTGGPSPYSNPAAVSNPYAPAPTAADNPYAPPPTSNVGVPPSNPYGTKPPSMGAPPSNPASFAPAFPSQAQGAVNDPYAPTGTPGSGLPAPPAVREASPNFANRQPVSASAPPPPRSKPEHGWNDAPVLSRKSTPAAGASSAASKMQAITSPFPNMPSAPATSYGAYNGQPGQNVPPPPPSRGSNRTPAPPMQSSGVAPPPMTGSRFVAPPPPSANPSQQMQQPQQRPPPPPQQQTMTPQSAPPATSGFAPPTSNYAPPPPPAQASQYAPPPPAQNSQNQYAPPPTSAASAYAPPPPSSNNAANGPPPPRQGFPAAPPPRSGTPGNSFRPPPPPGPPRSSATVPPPGPPNFPRPPSAGANRAIPPPQSNGSIPPVPNAPPQFQSMPPPPPPTSAQQGQKQATPPQTGFAAPPPPRPLQSQGSPVTSQPGTMTAPPPPPPTTQMRPEPPRLKYRESQESLFKPF